MNSLLRGDVLVHLHGLELLVRVMPSVLYVVSCYITS